MGLIRLFRSVMEADEEKKSRFVCKFCNKKFPCGKSLGGHLRSHSIARATEQKRVRAQFLNRQNARPEPVKFSPLSLNNEASSLSVAYVLRENPRKTQRFGDSGGERLCKECGKGFRSMKALCGHMACHSEKVMMMSKFGSDDDFSCFDRKLKRKQVVMDSQSDTEASSGTPRRGKRSKRMLMMTRYKNNLDFFNNSSYGSSSVSDIEQEQDQEVARCLIMLSRDSGLIGSFPDQSSDNNSVFLEPKSNDSSFEDMKIKNNIDGAEDSDSGNFRIHGLNYKVKSEVCVDGYARNLGFKRPKWVNHKPKVDTFDAESGKRGSKQIKIGSSVRGLDRAKDHELRASVAHKRSQLGHFSHDKSFNSICDESSIEADSFSVPNTSKANKLLISKGKKRLGTKKIKGHECPICFRVFRSGQALGGHKRSHFLGGSDGRTVVVLARQQDQVSGLFDLNLPAPEDSMAE